MQRNRFEVTGYLAAKPALRHLGSGTPVANVRLGESYRYQDADGKSQQHTNWHSLSFYGDLSRVAMTFGKGDNIFVEGTIEQRQFTPKGDRVQRTVHEVVVRSCHLIAIPRARAGKEAVSTMPMRMRSPTQQRRSIMTVGLWDSVRNARRAVLIATGVCVGTFQLFGFLGIRINTSPSLPIGLYITTQDRAANLVEFCPAEPFATLAIVRGYRDQGACPDGAAPLLKPIVARPGDAVEFSTAGISVNGISLRNTAPLSKDTKGRPLEAWPFGQFVVVPETVWVASTYHPRSFDSRYFGPVATSGIRNHLKALLVL